MYSTPPNSKIIASPRDIDENNLYVYDQIIDDAIRKAYDTYMLSTVSDPRNFISSMLGSVGISKYSSKAAIKAYKNKPYLYTLRSAGKTYTVEDFLNNDIPDDELNNDLNYAEILAVFGQNEEYEESFMSYSDFYDKFNKGDNAALFFEMEFEDKPTWFYWDDNGEVVIVDSQEEAEKHSKGLTETAIEKLMGTFSSDEETEEVEDTPESSKEGTKTTVIDGVEYPLGVPVEIRGQTLILKDLNDIKLEQDADEEDNSTQQTSSSQKKDKSIKIFEGIATLTDSSIYRGYGYFYDVKVYPYGLSEMYDLAEVKFAEPYKYATDYSNYEILNITEGTMRAYLGYTDKLGPSCYEERSYDSNIRDLMDEIGLAEPTGRSPLIWCYNSVNRLNYDEMDSKSNDIVYVAEGEAVILKMPYYINQGDFKTDYRGTTNETIKDSGCCDCSYTMCAMYYDNYAYDIRQISKDYVLSSTSLDTSRFLKDFNMAETRCTDPSGFKADTIESLRQGNPVVLHIKGLWTNPETKYQYHKTTNGHFLVIMGYDDNGFYVYDPGSDSNTEKLSGGIPYEMFFQKGLITDYRLITPTNSNVQKSFVINTLSGINEKASVNRITP